MVDTRSKQAKRLAAAGWSFWPIAAGIWQFVAGPGFMVPFLNHPVARLILLGACVWMVVGYFVNLRYTRGWQRILTFIVFPLPVFLLPMWGLVLMGFIPNWLTEAVK